MQLYSLRTPVSAIVWMNALPLVCERQLEGGLSRFTVSGTPKDRNLDSRID